MNNAFTDNEAKFPGFVSIPALNASSRKEASAIFSSFTASEEGRSCKMSDNLIDSKEHWQATAGGFCCGFVADCCCNCTAFFAFCILCLGWPTVNSARASLSVKLYVSSAASKDLNLPLRYVHTRPLTLLSVKSKHSKIHYLSICTTLQLKMCIISITKKWNCLGIFFTLIFSCLFNIGEDTVTQ